MAAQTLPTLCVVALQLGRFQGKPRRADDSACFKHESHRVSYVVRLRCICGARLLERRRIGTMSAHAVVKRGSSRAEPVSLRVIDTGNQPHELARDIAVKPRWPEGVLGHKPTR